MSLKLCAYTAAKAVRVAPKREELREVIRSLNFGRGGSAPEGTDRSQFGYWARHQHVQALGYLAVHEFRDRIPVPLPNLTEREIHLIGAFHRDIVDLNRSCASALLQNAPQCEMAIDPYSDFQYTMPSKSSNGSFISDEVVAALSEEFRLHPGMMAAVDAAKGLNRLILREHLYQAVHDVLQQLAVAGPHEVPAQMTAMGRNPGQPYAPISKFAAVLVGIRSSLAALNQILFQAIEADTLPMLDKDNVFNVEKYTRNIVGGGITLSYVHDKRTWHIEPGQTVLVSGALFKMDETILGTITRTSESLSQDHGTKGNLSLRILDEYLNPFPGLLT